MKINTDVLNVIYLNNKELSSMSIVEELLFNVEHNHANVKLLQEGRGKFSYRVKFGQGKYYFLKIWQLEGLKEWIKYSLNIDNANAEYQNSNHLRLKDIRVPEIFFFGRMYTNKSVISIQIMEFISTNLSALQYIKNNCLSKDFKEVSLFSDKVLTLTEDILNADIIDPDYRLTNLMVNEQGDPVKIDQEIAFKRSKFKDNRKSICEMLGTLIYSYVFAVQPNLELASDFTSNLYKKLDIDAKSIAIIDKVVMAALEKQLKEKGIDSRSYMLTP